MFNAGTASYNVSVANSVASITVTAAANDRSAAVINGNGVHNLNVGVNTITVTVRAEDGTTKDYTLNVERADATVVAALKSLDVSTGTLSPAFDADITSYSVSVANSVAGIMVTALANDAGAVVTGDGAHRLSVGANHITVTVTTADGTAKDYTITVTRSSDSGGSSNSSNSSNSSISGNIVTKTETIITPPDTGPVTVPAPGISVTQGEGAFTIEIDGEASERIAEAVTRLKFSESFAEAFAKSRSVPFATGAGYAASYGMNEEDAAGFGNFYAAIIGLAADSDVPIYRFSGMKTDELLRINLYGSNPSDKEDLYQPDIELKMEKEGYINIRMGDIEGDEVSGKSVAEGGGESVMEMPALSLDGNSSALDVDKWFRAYKMLKQEIANNYGGEIYFDQLNPAQNGLIQRLLMEDREALLKGIFTLQGDVFAAPISVTTGAGRTFVPLRNLEDALGFTVGWNHETQSATATYGEYGQSGQSANGASTGRPAPDDSAGQSSFATGGSAETGFYAVDSFGGMYAGPGASINLMGIGLEEGSLILSLTGKDNKTASNTEAPIIIFMPYELDGAEPDNVVMYDKNTEKTVAHSFWQNGFIVAAVTRPGHYDAKEETVAFDDTNGHWAENGIAFAASHGLISGSDIEVFSPDEAITRADFVMALGVLAGADVSGYTWSSFKDVQKDDPAMPYIEWAVKNGIVKGLGDNCFAHENVITREQMAVMTANYAKATNQILPVYREDNIFSDDAEISGWAAYSVMRAQWAGVVAGKSGNLFDPKGSATRAEAGEILRRFAIAVVHG